MFFAPFSIARQYRTRDIFVLRVTFEFKVLPEIDPWFLASVHFGDGSLQSEVAHADAGGSPTARGASAPCSYCMPSRIFACVLDGGCFAERRVETLVSMHATVAQCLSCVSIERRVEYWVSMHL